MNEAPLVSIRCLVYNHEPYLRQCLDGFVMQQTTFPFEAIVHDDASTDGSAAIIREYAEKYPDIIKPIYETENQYSKHDGSLHRIIDASVHPKSKYIAICEGDDYWIDPEKLQKQVNALETHPECTIAFSCVKTIKDGDEMKCTIPVKPELIPNGIMTLDDYMISEFYYGSWTFHSSTFVYKRSCLKLHNKLLNTVYKNYPYNDQPLLLSCLFQGKGFYIPEITGYYRVLSGGYNSSLKNDAQKEVRSYNQRVQAWKDIDNYTNKKYSVYITRHRKRFQRMSLEIQYRNGMMNILERFSFLFYWYWKLQTDNHGLKNMLVQFANLACPNVLSFYLSLKNFLLKKRK